MFILRRNGLEFSGLPKIECILIKLSAQAFGLIQNLILFFVCHSHEMTSPGIETTVMDQHPIYKALEPKKFILASTSPRRLEILNALGFKNVTVCPSNFPEDLKKEDYTPSEVSSSTRAY